VKHAPTPYRLRHRFELIAILHKRKVRKMNYKMGTTPPWALRILLMVTILCVPLLAGISKNWFALQTLTENYEQTQEKLLAHKQAERMIKQKSHQKEKFQPTIPSVLKTLFPLGMVLNENIALLTLDLNVKNQDIALDIAAKSLPVLLDFTEKLQHMPAQVELKKHNVAKDKTGDWPIRASINIHFPGDEG